MDRYACLIALLGIGPRNSHSESLFRTSRRREEFGASDFMETGQGAPIDIFVRAKAYWWADRDELHAWSLGMDEAEGKRLLNLKVAAMQEAAGLYKAELKYTDAKGKKYRRWFLMMPRGADGTLALDKPRFAPKGQVKLVNELDKHWDDLRDYSDMNIRRCSVTSQNMSEITEVLDALDAVFRDTDVPLAKPQEVETVINLIDAGKYQPPATAASPSNAKRGRRS